MPLAINISENFPNLPKPPIVESVITIGARAQAAWKEDMLLAHLKAKLPEYLTRQSTRKVSIEGPKEDGSYVKRHEWRGISVSSADKLQIVQFNPESYIFSRLAPYTGWIPFRDEALRLWNVYVEFAQPSEAQLVGVRSINRIGISAEGFRVKDYLSAPPISPSEMDLPVSNFLHQDVFMVPGHSLEARRTQMLQQVFPGHPNELGLLLDIEVSTTSPNKLEELSARLEELRWLKNRIFFGSVKKEVLENFK